jgi:hypothetical protein
MEDIFLPSHAHGLILITFDCRAKVEVDGNQDVLNGDEGIPMGGVSSIWEDCKQPGEVTNAKGKVG